MRAFVVTAPGEYAVQEVPAPDAAPGEAVIAVERVGVCGTDVEFFTGEMAYLHQGHARFPMRLGHEWCGTVTAVGDGADAAWVGRRVMGDTMLGDGVCRRCRRGHQHVCENRQEVGIRAGRPGALAEQLAVPVSSLHRLPDTVDPVLGALVEPGGNALRSASAAGLQPGDRVLVLGPGTIGLLAAMFARAADAEVHLLGRSDELLDFPRALGFANTWTADTLPDSPLRRGHRCLQRAAPARQGAGAGRARRPPGVHRTRRQPEPGRHADPRAQGRHRGRDPVRVTRSRCDDRGLCRRGGRPSASRRRDGRLGPGRSGPGWAPTGRRWTRTQDPRRPTTPAVKGG